MSRENPRAGSERVRIGGPSGELEGLWLPAGDSGARPGVLLCHPHPLYGGSMNTKLVARTARRLAESGYQTLRFNFRGVGASEGEWDQGRGEARDVRAALDYLSDRCPRSFLALFGFSFGAALALDVGSSDSRVRALVAVAPPPNLLPPILEVDRPTLIIAAGADEVVDVRVLESEVRARAPGAAFHRVEGADHLFTRDIETVTGKVLEFLDRHLRDENLR